MNQEEPAVSFGPVPSRRLGRSLGINNIPPKLCTYSCVYCQLGRTITMTADRSSFYGPESVYNDVSKRVERLEERGETIDFMAFVPDGEPTLDIDLGKEIEMLADIDIPLGVITNSSLIWDYDVMDALSMVDWVSLKVDAASERVWKRIDRPHGKLELGTILDGILSFSEGFKGYLCTETMLVKSVNDSTDELEGIASIISDIDPERAYLTLPLRPPAENWVRPSEGEPLETALRTMIDHGVRAHMLSDLLEGEFTLAGDLREEILRITSVHPIDKEGMMDILRRTGSDQRIIQDLLDSGELILLELGGKEFYQHNIGSRARK